MTTATRTAFSFLTLGVLAAVAAPVRAQLSIVIRAGSGLSSNQAALDSFNRAANQWASRISNPASVYVDADLAALGSNIIGSTDATFESRDFDTVRNAMAANAAAPGGSGIGAFLPTSATFRAALPTNFSLSGALTGTRANFKALGLVAPTSTATDGRITFSSNFSFDYDNRDGVTANTVDFETVAAHEIGHLLGFVSAVEDIDYALSRGQSGTVDPTTLDLFRFANGSAPSSSAAFVTAERSLLTGADAVTGDTISQYRMATGAFTGDGNQASHWKANEKTGTLIGIMDPTLANQEVIAVGAADLRAMNLIGYNVTTSAVMPEPSSLAFALPLIGFVTVTLRRRAKRVKTCPR